MLVIDPDSQPVAQIVEENMTRNYESEDNSAQPVDKNKEDSDDEDQITCAGIVLCVICGICIITKDAMEEGACF